MSSHDSKAAVYSAIAGNALVMVAKFVGAAITMSGSLLAEAIHSLADVGNQTLLAVGLRKSAQPPDDEHPFGYGREAFVWSLISAVGIFFLGCGVTVAHGVHTLLAGETHEVGSPGIAIGILVFALVVESIPLGIAIRGLQREAKGQGVGFFQNLRTTEDPFGIAVLLEDSAALLGVFIAIVAIALSYYTQQHYWDAIGSILIGVLLGGIALFLIRKNRDLLLGRAIRADERARLTELLAADPAIERVAVQRAAVAGLHRYRISAEIDIDGRYVAERYLASQDIQVLLTQVQDAESLHLFLREYGEAIITQTGKEIDRIEEEIREKLPHAHSIALEPD